MEVCLDQPSALRKHETIKGIRSWAPRDRVCVPTGICGMSHHWRIVTSSQDLGKVGLADTGKPINWVWNNRLKVTYQTKRVNLVFKNIPQIY